MIDLPMAVVNNLPLLVLASVVALSAALFSLPGLSRAAIRFGLVDRPSQRKTHGTIKPLVGGVGMAFAFFLSLFLCIDLAGMAGLLVATLTLVLIGLLDDRRGLNHWWKLLAQVAASLMIVQWSGVSLQTFGDLLSLGPIDFRNHSIPVTVFCIVGVANAFNMIDGADGLAGGISLIAFLSFACVSALSGHHTLMLVSGALCGAVMGFLRYNWHPARLFMGDAGSLFLGCTAAFISIALTQGGQGVVPPVVPLLILAVPITDTLTVIFTRVTRGKSPFRADRDHLHHTLQRMGLGARGSVSVILLISFLFSSLAVAGTLLRIPEPYLFLAFSFYFLVHLGFSFCSCRVLGGQVPYRTMKEMRTSATIATSDAHSSLSHGMSVIRHEAADSLLPLSRSRMVNPMVAVAANKEEMPEQDYVYDSTSKV